MKPYVICHMLSSIDGRTQSRHWGTNGMDKVFEETAAKIESDGWIVGRVTMSEFCSPKPRLVRKGTFKISKTDWVAPHRQKTYAISLDPSGKLHWERGNVDTEHVILVLTEQVTSEYLDHLRLAGVSYIFGGKRELNLKHVLEKLNKHFGIRRLTLQGGGNNNGSFLNQGLVDEVSLVIAPFADGETGTQSVFDIEPALKRKAHATRLRLVKQSLFKHKYPWLHYKVIALGTEFPK